MRRLFWIGFVVMAACAMAQESYTLKRDPKVGEENSYTVTLDIDFPDAKVLVSSKIVEKIVKLAETGDYDLETTYLTTNIKVKGQDNEVTVPPDILTYSPAGEVVLIRGKSDPILYRRNNFFGFILPDKPIKLQDSWKHTVAANPKTGAVELMHEYKFTGLEKVGAVECLVIKVSSRELPPADKKDDATVATASCEGTIWIDPLTSVVVKKDLVLKNLPSPPTMKGAVNAKLTVIRGVAPVTTTPPTEDKKTDDKKAE